MYTKQLIRDLTKLKVGQFIRVVNYNIQYDLFLVDDYQKPSTYFPVILEYIGKTASYFLLTVYRLDRIDKFYKLDMIDMVKLRPFKYDDEIVLRHRS